MCAIFGSVNKQKFLELQKLNEYRGSLSYSIAKFTRTDAVNRDLTALNYLVQNKGQFKTEDVRDYPDSTPQFFLGHTQAPTGQRSDIHPAFYIDPTPILDSARFYARLWHNGILKSSTIPEGMWDTQYMVDSIGQGGINSDVLNRFDGSFSCFVYAGINVNSYWPMSIGTLMLFRNELAPMFYDGRGSFSSTKFEGSKPVPPNVVWRLDGTNMDLVEMSKFTTKENPYYFAE